MNRRRCRQRPESRIAAYPGQRGAALVVGLVLMLILTILGVSGMNTATLELTMAANAQARQLTFQAAESAIETAVTGGTEATSGTAYTTYSTGDESYAVDTERSCVEITRVPDGAQAGDPSARAMHFEVTAVARGPRNAVSRLTQGFYVIVPAMTLPKPDAEGTDDVDCPAEAVCTGPACSGIPESWEPVRTYWRQDDIDD